MSIPGITRVYVPDMITVHLGPPNEPAENVTLPFIDYIKNVASSELYPTWPENALRANILAIVSIALNRTHTEWYRAKGYNFDITNSTRYDQSFVYGRGIFDEIDKIVDEIFNDYVLRKGQTVPLFTTFCDGRISQCEGMYQWGAVDLANQGYTHLEILKYYYGDDIEIITNAFVGTPSETYPGSPFKLGDSSPLVLILKLALNRISNNFPAIPKITSIDQNFNKEMEEAVKAFQKIFNLEQTGIIDKSTYYKIKYTYVAVRDLAELASLGSISGEITPEIEGMFVLPSTQLVQYFLNVLSTNYATIHKVNITGRLDPETRAVLMEFQKVFNLPVTGIISIDDWETLYSSAVSILSNLPLSEITFPRFIYPNLIYRRGSQGSGVYVIQYYLNYISQYMPDIPAPTISGVFDENTENSVKAFQRHFNMEPTGIVERITWDRMTEVYQNLKIEQRAVNK